MDRKLCVLVYSTYSAASKTLIEHIRSLPYDFAAVTGMTLLSADSSVVRDACLAKDIKTVPCLIVQYFDGNSKLLEDTDVYKFIASVSQSVGMQSPAPLPTQELAVPANIVSRDQVMSAATAMQKSREVEEPTANTDHPQGPRRTQLLPN
jgi:hypothetical protein